MNRRRVLAALLVAVVIIGACATGRRPAGTAPLVNSRQRGDQFSILSQLFFSLLHSEAFFTETT